MYLRVLREEKMEYKEHQTKFKVTPLKSIVQYLFLPEFEIEIKKNDYDVWECDIKDFGLYAHSADPDYTKALEKLKDRVQGIVVTHILGAIHNDRVESIYGLNISEQESKLLEKLKKSYNLLVRDNKQISALIKELSIAPFNYEEEVVNNIITSIRGELDLLNQNLAINDNNVINLLINALMNFNVYNFNPCH